MAQIFKKILNIFNILFYTHEATILLNKHFQPFDNSDLRQEPLHDHQLRVYLHVDANTLLPTTLTVKVQVALFPDWSTAVYLTT